ncbi:hypothetical protein [Phascolarctobacterium succinatutens]|uniref:hypothetical protein n=1 Tax=Phascolarctobacterium succinatutens TaxID=626940 RepID=UPI003AAB85CE
MNAGTIAQFLKLSPEKTAALEKAWGVASAAAQGVSSKEDAMRVLAEQNVGADVLDKAAGYLNNPIASVAAQAMGINLDKMRQDINSLRGATSAAFNASLPQQQQQASSLDAQMDALRKGLQQLK